MRQGRPREAQIPEALPCPAREAEDERVRVGRLLRFTTKSAEDTEISLSRIIGRWLLSPQKENSAYPCGWYTPSQIRAGLIHHFPRLEIGAQRRVSNFARKLHVRLVAGNRGNT